MYIGQMDTPIGQLVLRSTDRGLISISRQENIHLIRTTPHEIIDKAIFQLDQYFKGLLEDFDLPLDLEEYADFYRQVWTALCDIPYGQTKTYRDIAYAISNPKAVRAVGRANGKNPIAIVVPCHRVIGMNGALTGYAGGIEMKRWLLLHERAHSPVPGHMLF